MEFLVALIEAFVKMIIVGAFAFGGIMLGRFLRRRKDEKTIDTTEK